MRAAATDERPQPPFLTRFPTSQPNPAPPTARVALNKNPQTTALSSTIASAAGVLAAARSS